MFFAFSSMLIIFTCAQAHASDWHSEWNPSLTLFDSNDAPPSKKENGLGDWEQCLVKDADRQPVASINGSLLPGCLPDTLFTWGPTSEIDRFKKYAGAGQANWAPHFDGPIYTHINPLATFAYGDISIRIKLKPQMRFLLPDDPYSPGSFLCDKLVRDDEAAKNTVIVRYWYGPSGSQSRSGVDYILCSPGPIESWSYETKRHFDETAASLLWNQQVGFKDQKWIPYTVANHHNELFNSPVDKKDWSPEKLRGNLEAMRQAAQDAHGEIIFAPDVKPDDSSHFSSDHRVYWHWK